MTPEISTLTRSTVMISTPTLVIEVTDEDPATPRVDEPLFSPVRTSPYDTKLPRIVGESSSTRGGAIRQQNDSPSEGQDREQALADRLEAIKRRTLNCRSRQKRASNKCIRQNIQRTSKSSSAAGGAESILTNGTNTLDGESVHISNSVNSSKGSDSVAGLSVKERKNTLKMMQHVQYLHDKSVDEFMSALAAEDVEESQRIKEERSVPEGPSRVRMLLRHEKERRKRRAMLEAVRDDFELVLVQHMARLGLVR